MLNSTSSSINLYDPSLRIDPFATYARMLESSPVCQVSPKGIWMISGYDNVVYVLKNYAIFSSTNNNKTIQPEWMGEGFDYVPDYPLIFDDPPRHPEIRRFFTRKLQSEEQFMRDTADALAGKIKGKTSIDFVSDFIYPYINGVDCNLIGVEDSAHLKALDNWLRLLEMPPPLSRDQHYIDKLETTTREKVRFFQTLAHSQHQPSRDNVVGHLLQAMKESGTLTTTEFAALLEVFTLAVYQAPRHFLRHVIIQLACNPNMLQQLAGSPEKIPLFIEEALRFNSSLHFLFRRTLSPVTLSGITIPQGARVAVNLAGANRDPCYFANPETFDIERKNVRKHIAFGYGVHNCLGAALARMLAVVMVETIVKHFNEIRCPRTHELPWFYSLVTHSVKKLPVELVH